MVVFTCNHCGDSLQKPKVEKHYFTVCRKAKFVTCVDCFKDFRNEEYAAHTKCITEEERYAAKGSLPAQGIVKKGEVKQQSWTELVQSVVENAKLTASKAQCWVLDVMSNSVNVPRKKIRFINFVKSAAGHKVNNSDIEFIWGLIEKCKAEQNQPAKAEEKQLTAETDLKTENDSVTNQDQGVPKKKKKSKTSKETQKEETKNDEAVVKKTKKRKTQTSEETEQTTEAELANVSGLLNNDDVLGKKKKRKSQASEEIKPTAEAESANLDKINEDALDKVNDESGKKKKKKSKAGEEPKPIAEADQANTSTTNNEDLNKINGDVSGKKKKKKSKLNGVANGEILESTAVNGEEKPNENGLMDLENNKRKSEVADECKSAKKNKKAKHSNDNSLNITNPELDETNGNADKSLNDSEATSNFLFEEKILEVLKAKNNISLKKLEKKVLGAYAKQMGVEASEKTVKKFNKKLKKMDGIEVSEDSVTLK